MPWPLISLRDRRRQVQDDIPAHLPGADATVPNSNINVLAEAQAKLTHDNDKHLDWLVRMEMPDTAEGVFADRWANIWLRDGRKPATASAGNITVTGSVGAAVPTGAELTTTVYDSAGVAVLVTLAVTTGVTLATTSAAVAVESLTAGALANLAEGAQLAFSDVPAGIDGTAAVAAPGLAGGADQETDENLIQRYINRIQEPPHGGNANDWVQWALDIPGVTRAWGAQEMGVGTYTVRFMMDDVRAAFDGVPQTADLEMATESVALKRPTTVAQAYVLAPIRQDETVTIDDLVGDTPETRTAIEAEVAAMMRKRARPGGIIYASWIREAISAATGEDHHDSGITNITPLSAGHMVFLTVAFA